MNLEYNPQNPQDNQNLNLQQPNIDMEIESCLRSLQTLCNELQNTREPSQLSPATSLEAIISSIANSQG